MQVPYQVAICEGMVNCVDKVGDIFVFFTQCSWQFFLLRNDTYGVLRGSDVCECVSDRVRSHG